MEKKSLHDIEQYTACVIFYVTDMACNYIKALEPYIPEQDKETKRIWKALYKRYRTFFRDSNKVYGNGVSFIADFSSIVDDSTEACLQELEDSILNKLVIRNIENAEFISKVEIARVCTDFAVTSTGSMIKAMKEYDINATLCDTFNLTELLRVVNNFYLWVTRKIRGLNININENDEVTNAAKTLYESIMQYDNFIKAYQYAVENDKKIDYESKD